LAVLNTTNPDVVLEKGDRVDRKTLVDEDDVLSAAMSLRIRQT
jgi:hypothetical protein